VQALRERLKSSEQIVKSKACVYATGSFGRGEASMHSDLDLFIGKRCSDRILRRLDLIRKM
jgi:predicted nucleotidyltransferase